VLAVKLKHFIYINSNSTPATRERLKSAIKSLRRKCHQRWGPRRERNSELFLTYFFFSTRSFFLLLFGRKHFACYSNMLTLFRRPRSLPFTRNANIFLCAVVARFLQLQYFFALPFCSTFGCCARMACCWVSAEVKEWVVKCVMASINHQLLIHFTFYCQLLILLLPWTFLAFSLLSRCSPKLSVISHPLECLFFDNNLTIKRC
jgi:hypothetical protein